MLENKIEDGVNTMNDYSQINAENFWLSHIKSNSTILIIGTNYKLISMKLYNDFNCKLFGITDNDDFYNYCIKSKYFENVIKSDILTIYTDKKIINTKFDYIIFSDIQSFSNSNFTNMYNLGRFLKNEGEILLNFLNISPELKNHSYENQDNDQNLVKIITNFLNKKNKINESYIFDCEIIAKKLYYENYCENKEIGIIWPKNHKDKSIHIILFRLQRKEKNTTAYLNLIDNKIISENWKEKYYVLLNEYQNLKNNFDYIYSGYNKMVFSRSWKMTKIIRDTKETINDFKYRLTTKRDYKKNILLFVHSWLNVYNNDMTNIGGTTMHVLDLIKNNDGNTNFFVITIINNTYFLVKIEKDLHQKIYDIGIKTKTDNYDVYDYDFYYRIKNIIKILNIDLIHIHHLAGFPCDLQYIVKDIPTILTIHDYYLICSRYFLIDENDTYCSNKDANKCASCINRKVINLKIRETAIANLLKNVDKIIFPDKSVLKEFKKYFNVNNYQIIPHGIDTTKFKKFKYNLSKNDNKINIAFVGYISKHKGYSYMYDLIKHNTNSNINYHLFGESINSSEFSNCKNFFNHGIYNKLELPKLLNDNKIDLVLLLSVCPESFSYVLSEIEYAKIPVITIDIGALGSRVKKDKVGWVIPYNASYKLIENKINEIFSNNEYNEIKKNLDNIHIISIKEMVDEIFKIYDTYYLRKSKNYYKEELWKLLLKKELGHMEKDDFGGKCCYYSNFSCWKKGIGYSARKRDV